MLKPYREGERTIRADLQQIAQKLLLLLGGKNNIVDASHCATRLRLILHDDSKVDVAKIEQIKGVEGVFVRSGQYQIMFGTGTVNNVHRALMAAYANEPDKPADPNLSVTAKNNLNPLVRLFQMLSQIFVPIIPVIVASGLLTGLLGMMKAFHWGAPDSDWMRMLGIFSSAAFIILPVLIGFSAAKEFGSSPFMGAVIGGILTHPSLTDPVGLVHRIMDTMDVFGNRFTMIGYQGTVIPILLSVYLMSKLEKGLRKIIPPALDLLVVPFVTIFITGTVSLLVLGPLGTFIGSFISGALMIIYMKAGMIAGFFFGGLYPLIVMTGLHHSFNMIEAGLLADPKIGVNLLLPIWSMANVSQGGAGLAVFFMTRNQSLKRIAISSSLSSFLGIIEPVIFGVNLKLIRPLIGAAVGGALGGAYVVFAHVAANSYGLTGIPMIAIIAPLGMPNLLHYLIGFCLAVGSAFLTTLMLGINEERGSNDVK
ncbi:PTS sucrose transporter subunit IIBC [Paenibacillus sp. LMG 31458]|uniref:PTS sucrose transporter subunit IIBC n=1 Tax=Paenibacillus phytorum TaxID=2654977 RepID=A0ABX1Y828_9BACL|nr:PTS transporter subunit EIIC [Paenibacillus phytorum]NOU76694.1 PTS sucrose transporter subunit IIBC [Paenibacillus phytorum]